jgi:hypothetical protein
VRADESRQRIRGEPTHDEREERGERERGRASIVRERGSPCEGLVIVAIMIAAGGFVMFASGSLRLHRIVSRNRDPHRLVSMEKLRIARTDGQQRAADRDRSR